MMMTMKKKSQCSCDDKENENSNVSVIKKNPEKYTLRRFEWNHIYTAGYIYNNLYANKHSFFSLNQQSTQMTNSFVAC